MKVPFSCVLGPPLLRYRTIFNRICAPQFLGNSTIVSIFAILGLSITMADVIRIVKGKSDIPTNYWTQCPGSKDTEQPVSPEAERDLKLMALVLNLEHFTFLFLGCVTGHPALLLPWLSMETFIVLIEFILFVSRLLIEGLHMDRTEIIVKVFMIHNWLQVFCLFRKSLSICDL